MSTSLGNQAEDSASVYLEEQGFEIVARNWRTRVCEIDIIAKKKRALYFVEVKYRRNNRQGFGLDYITAKKLQQMEFAASCWTQENNWNGPYELAAIEVAADFKITRFLASLT